MNTRSDKEFWKRKLMAFLHDPPCKALNIGAHEEMARSFCRQAIPDMTESDWDTFKAIKDTDWTAAAADRFTFPKRKCAARFTGRPGSTFIHPLSGHEYLIEKLITHDNAAKLLEEAFGGITAENYRQRFFLYWRRWREEAVKTEGGKELAYMPADTRIPDHTIWTHMGLASALQACRNEKGEIRPAFLFFNLGPVQKFIAQARSTRDLWSGSYLLSWLVAHAMKATTDEIGPDCIIFPALWGQGIFDVLHKEEIYDKITYKGDTLWKRMYLDGERDNGLSMARKLLNPTLPNRFLALVASDRGPELAREAEAAVRAELSRISEACWNYFSELAGDAPGKDNWKGRWDRQVELFPRIAWAVVPWRHDIAAAMDDFAKLPVNRPAGGEGKWTPYALLEYYHRLATELMPKGDRDERYYTDKDKKDELNNPGFLWSANYHRADFALAARRNTREFAQFVTDAYQAGSPKDALTGREEIIGDEDFWRNLPDKGREIFKENEGPYGAISIIKRLWCRQECGYLFDRLGIDDGVFRRVMRFYSVADIACQNDAGPSGELDDEGDPRPKNPYVAVIVMDGDEMGKWIGGEKTPKFLDQLAKGAQKYFKGEKGGPKIDEGLPRPITPSYHMQFSEALANFSNFLAGRVVAEFGGQLVYAGGDDVLAMVPADKALRCARALRAAFRGEKILEEVFKDRGIGKDFIIEVPAPGFVDVSEEVEGDHAELFRLIVPGPKSDVSCGIAVAHYKHPLQGIVEEARGAERRAKEELKRGAFSVALLKRGGETIHWGAKWEYPGKEGGDAFSPLDLYEKFCELREEKKLSARFPYALAELLRPYDLGPPDGPGRKRVPEPVEGFPAREIIEKDLERVMERQGNWKKPEGGREDPDKEKLREACRSYLYRLRDDQLDHFEKLFLTAAFITRGSGEGKRDDAAED